MDGISKSNRLALVQRRPQPIATDVDEARLMSHLRRANLEREQARVLVDFVLSLPEDVSLDELRSNPRAAAGDRDALRGVPFVGVRGGRGGAIRGTRPGDNLR
jgi:hypothetical protein